jgi:ParB-like chromosome segregation protein Spo0J
MADLVTKNSVRAEAELHVSHMIIDALGELGADSEQTSVRLADLQDHMRQRVPSGMAGRYFQALHPDSPKESTREERQQRIEDGADGLIEWYAHHLVQYGLRNKDGKFWLDPDDPPKIRRPSKTRRVTYRPGEDALADRWSMQNAAARAIVADLDRILGPLDESLVATLRQSMERQGYIEQFPVIKDPEGHVLTGRHRLKAAELAKVKPAVSVFMGSDIDAAYAVLADLLERRHLSEKQLKAIEASFKAAGFDWEQIVKDHGLDPATMTPSERVQVGQDAQTDLKYKALDEELKRRIQAGQATNFRGVAKQFGFGEGAVQNRIQYLRGWLAGWSARDAAEEPGHIEGTLALKVA